MIKLNRLFRNLSFLVNNHESNTIQNHLNNQILFENNLIIFNKNNYDLMIEFDSNNIHNLEANQS